MKTHFLAFLLFLIPQFLFSQEVGTIYFVFGSDSSTPGINVRDRTAYYRSTGFNLFADPAEKAARLMDPDFRNKYKDSNGEPFRFTHWVQGGSLYRFAENTNIPYPSLMTNYLMSKYYAEAMQQFGDEYTYHYHTWVWSDPDGDGTYHWNQTPQYIDAQEDFLRNMAEALIEEDMFPVSFRSGWHFMDNDWQADLNDWVPFSLHNAHPSKKLTDPEPVDNLFDWSESPSTWVPYQPQDENYQLPGGKRGWNTRSVHFRSVSEPMIRSIFEAASQGMDQVPCIWSHVAEATFIQDFENVFRIIEKVAADYPEVKFRYDTAVEAMQRWLKTDDKQAPNLVVEELTNTNGVRIQVSTDEAIFQKYPFVAVKDIYENHRILEMQKLGENQWISVEPLEERSKIASWAVAVSDSVGNQSKYHFDNLPDDIYLDNEDPHFSLEGNWQILDHNALNLMWGRKAHYTSFSSGTAEAIWSHTLTQTKANSNDTHFDVFVRFPEGRAISKGINYEIRVNGQSVQSAILKETDSNRWLLLGDLVLAKNDEIAIHLSNTAENGETISLIADAVKLSAYRKAVYVQAQRAIVDLGQVLQGSIIPFDIELSNKGFEEAFITSIRSKKNYITPHENIDLSIAANNQISVNLELLANELGTVVDTILVQTTDPMNSILEVPVKALVKDYFVLGDNDDPAVYTETGEWNTSSATAYGESSRFAFIRSTNANAKAEYSLTVEKEGWYMLSFLVPSASNSALRALYLGSVDGEERVRKIMNQNSESTHWRWIDKVYLMEGEPFLLEISPADLDQNGIVLRTDAFQLEYMGRTLGFVVVDNDDGQSYSEEGDWSTSVSVAFGATSRFTNSKTAMATYTISGFEPGLNELAILLPQTVNSSTMANYTVFQGDRALGESVTNQNDGSGEWSTVGGFFTESTEDIRVLVQNIETGNANRVLRTDAIRWTYAIKDGTNTSIEDEHRSLPKEVSLHSNYPNPFNPTTTIQFDLPEASDVLMEVYSIQGTRVATLINNQRISAGSHMRTFTATGLSSGVYLLRFRASGIEKVTKMLLLK